MTHLTIVRRYSASVAFSVATTAGLLLIMHYAIHSDEPTTFDPVIGTVLAFSDVQDDPPIEPERRIPQKTPPPDLPPPTQPTLPNDPYNGEGVAVGLEPPVVVVVDNPTATGDGEALPVVMVTPTYPNRAMTRGIEGWVIVEFSVDRLGRVQAPRVLESQPSGVFDRAALNALKRYKYKPRVVDGEPVVVHGLRHRIVFELTQA